MPTDDDIDKSLTSLGNELFDVLPEWFRKMPVEAKLAVVLLDATETNKIFGKFQKLRPGQSK